MFSLHDPAELERLCRDAGFRDVTVRVQVMQFRLPAALDFLWQYIHSAPLSTMLENVEPDRINRLERDVVAAWKPWSTTSGMTCDLAMILASAWK